MGIRDFIGKAGHDLFGPNYNYAQQIKTPLDMSMGEIGNLSQLSGDVGALIEYVQVLVSGPSDALKKPDKPLGNKFFLGTMGTCKDRITGESEKRYIYINNVPTGNIPLLSAISGTDLSEFRGLAPGILTNINVLNPIELVEAMFIGADPECAKVTWPTINNSGNVTPETRHILVDEIKNMDPCDVSSGYCKPSWGYDANNAFNTEPQCCTMGFQNKNQPATFNTENDVFIEVYFMVLALLGLFILLKLMHKTR